MLNENLFIIHHLNFISEFIQKGTQRVPFCIPPLFFVLYSLCFD